MVALADKYFPCVSDIVNVILSNDAVSGHSRCSALAVVSGCVCYCFV